MGCLLARERYEAYEAKHLDAYERNALQGNTRHNRTSTMRERQIRVKAAEATAHHFAASAPNSPHVASSRRRATR